VNNVETLVAAAGVLRGDAPGTKLFCVSGNVQRAGVYEVPFGMPLRELLQEAGADARSLRAVLLGGAAGTFVTPEEFDVPLSFDGARSIGATLGSGVVMAFDDTVDLVAIVRRLASFFRHESCGQCVPCRVGTVRMEESLTRLATGTSSLKAEQGLLDDLTAVMRDASICGLGQTAPNAVMSAISKLGVFP